MGRTPDFKAAFLSTLGSNRDHYSPFEDNAARWYKESQEKVLSVGHGIVNPPVDRDRDITSVRDVYLTVERETDAGLIVSGAKVVGTGAALTQYIFVGSYGTVPAGAKDFSAYFMIPTNSAGLKIISRASYEYSATALSSPFDSPLSSRMVENDGILVFDNVLVPWENIFCYHVAKANNFFIGSGFFYRAMLHGCVRFAVKLDFLSGLLAKGLDTTGTIDYRAVRARLGEVLSYRHIFWGLVDSMTSNPTPWPDGTVAAAYRFLHDLYGETLSDQVPPSRQQRWHLQIGARKETGYGAQACKIAAELAVHFERGRDPDRAIRFLQHAADNALRRSAYTDAITHLTKALALLSALPETPERAQRELDVQLALGPAFMATKGLAAPEVAQTYARARMLCEQVGETPQVFSALRGLAVFYQNRGVLPTARELRTGQSITVACCGMAR